MNTKNEWEKQNTLRWILQIVKEARSCSLTCEVRVCCRIILHQLSFFSINCEAFGKISTTFPSKLKRHLNQFLLSGEIIVCFAPLLPKGPFHRFISMLCCGFEFHGTENYTVSCRIRGMNWHASLVSLIILRVLFQFSASLIIQLIDICFYAWMKCHGHLIKCSTALVQRISVDTPITVSDKYLS